LRLKGFDRGAWSERDRGVKDVVDLIVRDFPAILPIVFDRSKVPPNGARHAQFLMKFSGKSVLEAFTGFRVPTRQKREVHAKRLGYEHLPVNENKASH